MKFHRSILALILTLLFIATSAYAQEIIGEVVGISDGDTIKVLQNKTQYKIRLYGIDTPERKQAFGNKARQFLSDLVFRKMVRVVEEDVDRYGRIVGTVYIGDTFVNEEIIRNGYGWVYRKYCKKPFCAEWLRLEKQAKEKEMGLWSHKNPIPPWDYRRGKTH